MMLNFFQKNIELNPNHIIAHNNLGIIFQSLGKLKDAETCYRRTIELKPDHIGAYNNLGTILQLLGRLDEAEFNFRKIIKLKPDFAMATAIQALQLKNLED